MKIFLLCKNLPDHGQFEVVAWSHIKAAAEGEAYARCWAAYYDAIEQPPVPGVKHLSPDETAYREFFVKEVDKLPPPMVTLNIQAGGMYQCVRVSQELLDDAQAFARYISEETLALAERAAKEKTA